MDYIGRNRKLYIGNTKDPLAWVVCLPQVPRVGSTSWQWEVEKLLLTRLRQKQCSRSSILTRGSRRTVRRNL